MGCNRSFQHQECGIRLAVMTHGLLLGHWRSHHRPAIGEAATALHRNRALYWSSWWRPHGGRTANLRFPRPRKGSSEEACTGACAWGIRKQRLVLADM